MLILKSRYDPRAPPLAAVEGERKSSCNEKESSDMREDPDKKQEHFYPVKTTARCNQAVTAISFV